MSSLKDIKLKVITEKDFLFLASKNPGGVYDKETTEKLYWIIKRLSHGIKYCTGDEKQLQKKSCEPVKKWRKGPPRSTKRRGGAPYKDPPPHPLPPGGT